MKIVLEHLTKKFPNRNRKVHEDVIAVSDFDFEIPDGKLVGLLGPSGCGKSTTLNLICGLLKPTEGHIYFGEDDVTGLPAENRGVGLVFQNYALYPHLTVQKNIQFPLENLKGADKLSKEEMQKRVYEAAKLVQIEELMDRKPSELSGGQQQRVAIARALVKMPKVLLLDEPLSNLDARLRLQTREEIRRIQKQTQITTIFVTHDQDEAMSISDMIVVMKDGLVQQIGKPQEVFDRPASPFIADFMGFSTFLHGIAAGAEGDMRLIRCGAHTLQVPAEAAQELTEGDACILAIRSENIRTAEQEGVNTVRGTVKSATYKGHTTRLEVSGCFEEMVYPAIHEYADVQEGSEVLLHFPAQHFCVYKDIK